MNRRTFVTAVAACCAIQPFPTIAELARGARRIGILSGGTVSASVPAAFFDGLQESGWVEGKNLTIERRGADGNSAAAPALAAELVRLNVDAIVTFGAVAGVAARNATTTIPIVAASGDPVRLGLVSSMSHPGGNITGFSAIAPELAIKRLELLREMLPKATRVGEIVDRANQYWYRVRPEYEEAFRSLKLQPLFVEIEKSDAIPAAIAEIASRKAEAFIVRGDPMLVSNRGQIARLALEHRLPTVAEERAMTEAGMLVSYGTYVPAAARRFASIVDRVLRGTTPGDIPIEQATQFELVINATTAAALGIAVPQSMRLRGEMIK